MRMSLLVSAISLACASCLTDADDEREPVRTGLTPENVAKDVMETEHDHLKAWCAADGRIGSDVAVLVVDLRDPTTKAAEVRCEDVVSAEAPLVSPHSVAEEPIAEAQEPLTPIGWGCLGGLTALTAYQAKACGEHPEKTVCGQKFLYGQVGIGIFCGVFL